MANGNRPGATRQNNRIEVSGGCLGVLLLMLFFLFGGAFLAWLWAALAILD